MHYKERGAPNFEISNIGTRECNDEVGPRFRRSCIQHKRDLRLVDQLKVQGKGGLIPKYSYKNKNKAW